MTKRQKSHSDNALTDKAGALPTPGQGSRSGGKLAQKIGTRAELHVAFGGEPSVERVVGHDDPDADAAKGPKTQSEYNKRK